LTETFFGEKLGATRRVLCGSKLKTEESVQRLKPDAAEASGVNIERFWRMKRLFAIAVTVVVLIVLAVAISALNARRQRERNAAARLDAASAEASAKHEGRRAPVVVELFTSEGCSSCPPADALLARLERDQPVGDAEIIVLAQHVDYWNELGWTDPYSSHEASERQSEYAGAFGKDGVYTPQMVIDGRTEFPGGNSNKALDAIAQAAREPKAEVALVRSDSQESANGALRLSVRVLKLPKLTDGDTADVMLAVTESGLSSDVQRGENAGHKLAHVGVVRKLAKIGSVSASDAPFKAEPTVALDKGWRRENMRAVVFLQEHTSLRVVGAVSLKL
jgi:hypothetical protein